MASLIVMQEDYQCRVIFYAIDTKLKEDYFMDIQKCGALFSPVDVRDHVLRCTSSQPLPESHQLSMVRVKNQGNVGSCVAHALAEVVEYYNSVQLNDREIMSTGFIYGNREYNTKGEGMYIRGALKALQKYGDCKKNNFRENVEVPEAIELFEKRIDNLKDRAYPYRISSYARVFTKEAVKRSLLAGNPVVIAVDWYSDMKVKDGVLTSGYSEDLKSGGHCMVIYGYDEEGWKVQNSWGTYWGVQGTCTMPYKSPIREMWVVTDNIIDGTEIDEKFTSTLGKLLAKLLNKLIGIFNR